MKYLYSRAGILSILALVPEVIAVYARDKELFTTRVKAALVGMGPEKTVDEIDDLCQFLFAPWDLATDYNSVCDGATHRNLRAVITIVRSLVRWHYAEERPAVVADLQRFADRAQFLQRIDSGKIPLTAKVEGGGASAAASAPQHLRQRVKTILEYDVLDTEAQMSDLISNAHERVLQPVATTSGWSVKLGFSVPKVIKTTTAPQNAFDKIRCNAAQMKANIEYLFVNGCTFLSRPKAEFQQYVTAQDWFSLAIEYDYFANFKEAERPRRLGLVELCLYIDDFLHQWHKIHKESPRQHFMTMPIMPAGNRFLIRYARCLIEDSLSSSKQKERGIKNHRVFMDFFFVEAYQRESGQRAYDGVIQCISLCFKLLTPNVSHSFVSALSGNYLYLDRAVMYLKEGRLHHPSSVGVWEPYYSFYIRHNVELAINLFYLQTSYLERLTHHVEFNALLLRLNTLYVRILDKGNVLRELQAINTELKKIDEGFTALSGPQSDDWTSSSSSKSGSLEDLTPRLAVASLGSMIPSSAGGAAPALAPSVAQELEQRAAIQEKWYQELARLQKLKTKLERKFIQCGNKKLRRCPELAAINVTLGAEGEVNTVGELGQEYDLVCQGLGHNTSKAVEMATRLKRMDDAPTVFDGAAMVQTMAAGYFDQLLNARAYTLRWMRWAESASEDFRSVLENEATIVNSYLTKSSYFKHKDAFEQCEAEIKVIEKKLATLAEELDRQ